MGQSTFRDQILVGRIGHDGRELRRRDTVSNDVNFVSVKPKNCHGRVLAEFECQLVEIGNTFAKIFGLAFQNDALARNPFDELEGAGADWFPAKVCAVFFTSSLGTTWAKLSASR